MRQILTTIAAIACLAGAAPVGAITAKSTGTGTTATSEKKTETTVKKVETKKTEKKVTTKKLTTRRQSQGKLLDQLKKQVRDSKVKNDRTYDQYIDKNKDGINDRVRSVKHRTGRKSVKTASPPQQTPKPAVRTETPKREKTDTKDEAKPKRQPPR